MPTATIDVDTDQLRRGRLGPVGVEMGAETAAALRPYLALFRDLIDRRVSAPEFEERFRLAYLNDATRWDQHVFDILDRVFAAADAFVGDDALRPEVIDAIDEPELRATVNAALAQLDEGM